MKTLILFLFLASMAWGQIEVDGDSVRVTQTGKYTINTSDNTINFTSFEPMVYYFSSDTTNPVNVSGKLYKNKIGVYQTMVVATLLQQYEAYTKECWADSTKEEELKLCNSLVYPPCKGHSYNPPRYYIIHKEPTFTGFIEFLKRGVK